MRINEHPASFRDPSGFTFLKDGKILRQINPIYKKNYERLMVSGLYEKLTKIGALIPHTEVKTKNAITYKVIEPKQIPFISYPYEWCFSQLKDAAILTLQIQKISLSYGMSLKDASSFNVQFLDGKPIFIDTLSFEIYPEGKPWVAYRQFCEQFLAPLSIISKKDIRLAKLLQVNIGSIDLDLAQKLLPSKSKFIPGLFVHIYLHSLSQKKYSSQKVEKQGIKSINKKALIALIDSLESTVKNLKWQSQKTTWSDYYGEDTKSYTEKSSNNKKEIVSKYLKIIKPKNAWDIGANTGLYSKISAGMGAYTISLDNDPAVVENNYLVAKKEKIKNILPLWVDISNPTPTVGWENAERDSLLNRPHPDTVLALALVHHLAIANNLPLSKIAKFFSEVCNYLIIEFVPKEDGQVKILLQNREDIFKNYNQHDFEKEFSKYFKIKNKELIYNSKRTLYLMVK